MRKPSSVMCLLILVFIFGMSVSYSKTGDFTAQNITDAKNTKNTAGHTETDIETVQSEPPDTGLDGAVLNISSPDILPAGEILNVSATLTDFISGYDCELIWYINNVPVLCERIITGDIIPELTHSVLYSHDLPGSLNVKAELIYTNIQGDTQTLSAVNKITLQNYSKQHWIDMATDDVLSKVTSEYTGDYTLQYALDNDYTDFEKEVWVNAHGYKSKTDYLIWISLTYQRVYVFHRAENESDTEDGLWELVRTCLAGTGKSRTETPRGIFYVNGKQEDGWNMSSFRVRPVVNFSAGPNYAFHSRPYTTDFKELYDPSLGFPVSRGCIRMDDKDIRFLFDAIAVYTTVIVH